MKPALIARKLSKTFPGPRPIILFSDISLEVYSGQTVVIMGKSGEGKTTLLHLLGTLEAPTKGSVEICGIPAEPKQWNFLRNQKIGFIFQSYNLIEEQTALENVLLPAKIARQPTRSGSPAHRVALSLLEEVGLLDRADFPTKLLSGGEKQRVTLARAFCNDPELILADEPSGNLDHSYSQLVYDLLIKATKKRLKALVVVTHDMSLAQLCEKRYLLMDGTLRCIS